ncbi:MAG: SAP domain-containing protein [Verrucomicrobiota bacterium]
MKFSKCVTNISTITELKRIASAYVIDYRALSEEEIKEALVKTAPQYYFEENVRNALNHLTMGSNRDLRIIAPFFIKHVLMQRDDRMSPRRNTEEEIIKWEQEIVDRSNEDLLKKSSERSKDLEFMQFVVKVAWEHNDDLSVDEKNLVEKIRERLRITETEFRIIEAKLGKFPKSLNELHTRQDIEDVRRELQARGLVFSIRDHDGIDYDLIPSEVADTIAKVMKIEIRDYGFSQLLRYKAVRSKSYIQESLDKVGVKTEKNCTMEDLFEVSVEQMSPRILLGGTSPRDGLPTDVLRKWCSDLDLNVSGSKSDLIERIIEFYDSLHERSDQLVDEREHLHKYFIELATRDSATLRAQQLIEKDIEIERKFESVTDYVFEKKLGHKPLNLIGTNHADGALSYKDKVIYWDNKSKETPVNLKDHIRQFDGYIQQAEKPVAGFVVIGPDFTPESSLLAMQYQVEKGTIISMITAQEFKDLGEVWSMKKETDAFPLGYLLQPGRFNPSLVAI